MPVPNKARGHRTKHERHRQSQRESQAVPYWRPGRAPVLSSAAIASKITTMPSVDRIVPILLNLEHGGYKHRQS